ncbi:hypothetical protein GNI_223730, partial [Gregarina niphandrodes]
MVESTTHEHDGGLSSVTEDLRGSADDRTIEPICDLLSQSTLTDCGLQIVLIECQDTETKR